MHDPLTALLAPVAKLFEVESVEAMALRILGAVLVLLAAFWISGTTQRYLVRRLQRQDTGGAQAIQSYRRIVQAVVWVIGGAIALHTLGIDLTHMFTAGGLFAVALAFAMKDLAENLVSGLLLRLGGEIKHGDVLRTEDGEIVQVKKIGSRTSIVRTKEEADRIIPNAALAQNAISNYTHGDSLYRLETTVGVAYESDLRKVRTTLETVCEHLDWKSAQKQPLIQLLDFGDSSVVYRVLVWIEDPWISGRLRSELNEAIWWALKDVGIVIAFPQLDVHIAQDEFSGSGNAR
jgi:small-conductance mechanosensitive channel